MKQRTKMNDLVKEYFLTIDEISKLKQEKANSEQKVKGFNQTVDNQRVINVDTLQALKDAEELIQLSDDQIPLKEKHLQGLIESVKEFIPGKLSRPKIITGSFTVGESSFLGERLPEKHYRIDLDEAGGIKIILQ